MIYLCVFFFFQAEDGIRDKLVTRVQTCALPILPGPMLEPVTSSLLAPPLRSGTLWQQRRPRIASIRRTSSMRCARSEERRVGKEGRSRWSAYHQKKKQEIGTVYRKRVEIEQ